MMPYSAVGKHEILFIPKPSLRKEKWDGKTIDKEETKKISGINEIEYTEDFFAVFQKLQNWKTKLYVEKQSTKFQKFAILFCGIFAKDQN